MGKRTVVPFGPQHPVLPEPIHLDLVLEDEKVVEAVPNIGFIHRGLEGLVEKKDYNELIYIAERTCGICSYQHGMGYTEALEQIMGVEIPDRARYLRSVWSELGRMHSHLLWLGLLADGFGFESLFYECWRIREKILNLHELTTGARLIFSVNKVGGVLRDITPDMQKEILATLEKVEEEVKNIQKTFLFDYSVQSRLRGIGVLTLQQVHDLGCVGPFARASGLNTDMRKLGYDAYPDVDFEPIISTEGDCFARCDVRTREIFQSIDIIRQFLSKIPEGDIAVPVKGMPKGEATVRVEQPRGEAVYYVQGNGTKLLDRMRIRTPTFANLPGLLETMKGADLADVPLLILSIDPCISCTER